MPCSILAAGIVFWTFSSAAAQGCSNSCNSGGGVLCPGDSAVSSMSSVGKIPVCHPVGEPDLDLATFYSAALPPQGPARIVVMANHYIGCNAGRREANVYTYTSKLIHVKYPNVVFVSSLKGGSSAQCAQWSSIYESSGAIDIPASVQQTAQPINTHDASYVLRDTFFTAPFPHPSYVIIDFDGNIRYKFVGPCCGYAGYFQCSTQTAMSLNETLTNHIEYLMQEATGAYGGSADCFFSDWSSWDACDCSGNIVGLTRSRSRELLQNALGSGTCSDLTETEACSCTAPVDCEVSDWTSWANCDLTCGTAERSRTRNITVQPSADGTQCPSSLVEIESCQLPACQEQCVPLLGETLEAVAVATAQHGLSSPRDIAFTPKPGFHLGNFSSAQTFPIDGPEAWIANGDSHSITIIPSVGLPGQKALTRFDRGYYHYMNNITALSFNSVSDSGRHPDRDTYGYFGTCQDNPNDYIGTKYRNFFMGPTLYNSDPSNKNVVSNDGEECSRVEECFFLHTDMLHESPSCAGIIHDPEETTAYGTVFWAIDGVVEHLVRYDFQQPHGPGNMDHSIAAVRRYPDVQVPKGPAGLHVGMAVDAVSRRLYIASAVTGKILEVNMDSGEFARTAREEYPVFSSYLPSFEYSIWGCMQHGVFAEGLDMPSGLALQDGTLYVGEYSTGSINIYDIATGFRIRRYASATSSGLMGLAIAPTPGGHLFGVNALTNELLEFRPSQACAQDTLTPYANPGYEHTRHEMNASNCTPNSTIPSEALFEQVHVDSGYADSNAAAQNDTIMDASAYFLRFRTNCSDPSLNFDALLLGGYLCHPCLPDNCASRAGGICTNVWWSGYTCDNEFRISGSAGNFECDREIRLTPNRTYRFILDTPGAQLSATSNGQHVIDLAQVGETTVAMIEPFMTAIVDENGMEIFAVALNTTTVSFPSSSTVSPSAMSAPASSTSSTPSASTESSSASSTLLSTTATSTQYIVEYFDSSTMSAPASSTSSTPSASTESSSSSSTLLSTTATPSTSTQAIQSTTTTLMSEQTVTSSTLSSSTVSASASITSLRTSSTPPSSTQVIPSTTTTLMSKPSASTQTMLSTTTTMPSSASSTSSSTSPLPSASTESSSASSTVLSTTATPSTSTQAIQSTTTTLMSEQTVTSSTLSSSAVSASASSTSQSTSSTPSTSTDVIPFTTTLTGSLAFTGTNLTQEQVEVSSKKALAATLQVTASAIEVNVSQARRLREYLQIRRLAENWLVDFTIAVPAETATVLQTKVNGVQANSSALSSSLKTELINLGLPEAQSTISITEFSAIVQTTSTTPLALLTTSSRLLSVTPPDNSEARRTAAFWWISSKACLALATIMHCAILT